MTREEAITLIKAALKTMYLPKSKEYVSDLGYALEIAIKALEREQHKYTRQRHCDCCGILLTKDNNKCGYGLCDNCNERLEQKYRKEQEDNGFFDEIMDDELEDEETYEKIKEIINEVKEQEE